MTITVILAALSFTGVVLTALWSSGGYSHRSRTRRSLLQEFRMYADMADGDSRERLKAHLDARVDLYLQANAQPTWIHPQVGRGLAIGGVAVSALGIFSLLIDDLDVGWSLAMIGAGAALALGGWALAAQAREETRRADTLSKQLKANREAAAERLPSGEPRET